MYYYRATIQYDGTERAGFQWQADAATIQSDVNEALAKLIPHKFSTVAASRTDSGVHARQQVVKLTSEVPVVENFVAQLNRYLPKHVQVITCSPCLGEFHPSAAAKLKEYRYFFTNRPSVPYEKRRFVANMSHPLNLSLMQECCQLIVGAHDFQNFASMGSNVKTTVREVLSCDLQIVNPHKIFENSPLFVFPSELLECFQFRIEGQGFLKQMVRHFVAALWMVGSSKLSVSEFRQLLHAPKLNKQLWRVASPKGLFLYRIDY